MSRRPEVDVDSVSYSDRPFADGPAPFAGLNGRGRIIEVTVTDGEETYPAEFQCWRTHERASVNVAGHMAWQIANSMGEYGVFDDRWHRIWFGEQPAIIDGRKYHYVDIGEAWRDKIYRHDFTDKINSGDLQYPLEQDGPLTETSRPDLVSTDGDKSSVCELDITHIAVDDATYLLQFWRPADSRAVYVACRPADGGEADVGTHGIVFKQTILTDINWAIWLNDETLASVVALTERKRGDDGSGLTVTEESAE